MDHTTNSGLTQKIVEQAVDAGASVAGVVSVDALRPSPSHQKENVADWSKIGRSVIVMALLHDKARPELDWWDGNKGTPGNRRLIETGRNLAGWLKEEYDLETWDLPYYPSKGGVFLKDAAVLAGLGVMGRNNLLLTLKNGPLVRLRGLACARDLTPTEPVDTDPCEGCSEPCIDACPQEAFIDGDYSRNRCYDQMHRDEDRARSAGSEEYSKPIKYCRACELYCPLCG